MEYNKKHLLKKIFLAVLFGTLFAGEVLFSIYGNYQNSDDTAFKEEQGAIRVWRKSDSLAVLKQRELALSLTTIGISSRQKTVQNQAVIDAGKSIERKLYDDKVLAAEKEKVKLQAQYDIWEAKQLQPIREFYARKRARSSESSWLGFFSGLQLGLVASLTAIGLAYLAGRVEERDWRNVLLILSLLAQIVACTTAWHGIMAKYDDPIRAWLFAGVFALCAPAVYHFGPKEWMNELKKAESLHPVLVTVEEPKVKIETHEHTEEESLIHRKTIRSSKAELEVPVSLTSAVMLYRAGKISKDNGWSLRRIAKEFAKGNVSKVHRMIQAGCTSPAEGEIALKMKQAETE
jgi:hypothetical protein